MAGEKFPGSIVGRVIELRFSSSGTVRFVGKQVGDTVKAGELVASLDTALLQKELDIQLADFEKERADFEIFGLKNNASGQLLELQKKMAQASLDSSVKSVEVAKLRLDQAQLISPLSGLVLDMGGLLPGINATPSANSIQVLDASGFIFQFEISQPQLSIFRQPHHAQIRLPNFPDELSGATSLPMPGAKNKFIVNVRLAENFLLLPGLAGEVELTE